MKHKSVFNVTKTIQTSAVTMPAASKSITAIGSVFGTNCFKKGEGGPQIPRWEHTLTYSGPLTMFLRTIGQSTLLSGSHT